MITHIYKIEYQKSSDDINKDYDRFSDYEKERISDLDADTYFDYDSDEEKYVCYLITTPKEIDTFSKILSNNLIKHNLLDISSEILLNKITLKKDLKSILTTTGRKINFSLFEDDVNDWILENLEIDIILDRISELGDIKKLNKIEKEFLKNFKM